MKIGPTSALVLVAALLVACGGGSTDPQPSPEADPVPPASPVGKQVEPAVPAAARPTVRPGGLTFERPVVDFGSVDDSRVLTCEFAFTNDTDAAIQVRELKSSCGCTVPELVKRTFEPGEADVIELSWEPKGQGAQTQTVDVFTEGAKAPTRLYVKALVRQRVKATPAAADFGDIPMSLVQAVQIRLDSTEPVEVLGVRGELRQVLADYVPAGGRPTTGRLGLIDLRLLPMTRRGPLGTSVILDLRVPATEDTEAYEYEMKLPVRAKVYGAVKADPAGFYVSRVDPGGDVDYRVRLRRPGGGEFALERCELAQCTIPGLALIQESGTDEQGFFVDAIVRGSVGDYEGPLRGRVQLLTDVPGDEVLNLDVLGIVRPPG